MRTLVIDLFQDKKKSWRFRLVSGNGRILASSEAYSSRSKAINGVNAFIQTDRLETKVNGVKEDFLNGR